MTPPERPPLSDEERALARRLAELDAHAGPSPLLDARIRAAARMSQATRPRARRWPALLGLAASLVLAVGIAWQLQLRPASAPAPRTESEAMRMVIRPAPSADSTMAPAQGKPETATDAGVAAAPGAAPQATTTSVPTEPEEPPAAKAIAPEKIAAPAPAEIALPSRAAPAPMSLPPPPPPPPAPVVAPEITLPHPAAAPAPPPATTPVETAPPGDAARQAAMASDRGDEPESDVPPATADSPAVRDAWLQRIRGLVASGDLDGARASLREFVRRYPDAVLPEDLRPLAP